MVKNTCCSPENSHIQMLESVSGGSQPLYISSGDETLFSGLHRHKHKYAHTRTQYNILERKLIIEC